MGVSGCGKSTVAKQLADLFCCEFVEADDFHSEHAKRYMASGKALNDDMRAPWIHRIKQDLEHKYTQKQSVALSFSGLRQAHRDALRGIFNNTLFLHLVAPYQVIVQRIHDRSNHFMPPTLLESQFAALESTDNEKDVIDLDAKQKIDQLIQLAGKQVSLITNQTLGENKA